jgi:ATP-dependent Clp protease ATP-binding subunit ClpB
MIIKIKETREKIDNLRIEADERERNTDFAKVAKIRYGDIPTLEKEIENIEKGLGELQENGKSFLKDKVTEEDIAEIISKWT